MMVKLKQIQFKLKILDNPQICSMEEKINEKKDSFLIWGQDLSKMRYRAFEIYKKDYAEGIEKFPEFEEEFNQFVKEKKIE